MPTLTPGSFGFRCEIDVSGDKGWPLVAFEEVLRAAKVRGEAGGSWGSAGDVEGAPRLLVGLSVLGFKKSEAIVSFAAFDPASKQLLAWSRDHADNPDWRGETRFSVRRKGKTIPLDADARKRIKGVAQGAPAAAPGAAQLRHEKSVIGVAVTSDGRRILSTGFDAAVCVWDAVTGALVHRMTNAGGRGMSDLNAIDPSRDGASFVTGAKGFSAFDTATGNLVRAFEGHSAELNDLRFSPTGRWIASASADDSVALWDSATGARVERRRLPEIVPGLKKRSGLKGLRVAFSKEEERLFVLTEGPNVVLALELPSLAPAKIERLEDCWEDANSLVLSGASLYVNVCDQGEIRVMSAKTLALQRTLPVATSPAVSCRIDVSPDGELLAATTSDRREFVLLEAKSGALVRKLPFQSDEARAEVGPVRFFPGGEKLVGAAGTRLFVWDVSTGRQILPAP